MLLDQVVYVDAKLLLYMEPLQVLVWTGGRWAS